MPEEFARCEGEAVIMSARLRLAACEGAGTLR
jgi:hypothetical protein